MNKEIWSEIAGFEGFYEVSSLGRVRSCDREDSLGRKIKGLLIAPNIRKDGRAMAHLFRNSKRKSELVSRLVAKAFVANPKQLPQVNHKDGNKKNDSATNLEWCTNQENRAHAVSNGLSSRGGKGAKSKLSTKDVKKIRILLDAGALQKDLAKQFGVSRSLICLITKGKRWVHLCP